MFNAISQLGCIAIGLLYPSYQVYRALKYNEGPTVKLELLVVLSVCAAVLQASALVFDPLFAAWMPFYHLAKLLFVAWLAAPQTNGAWLLYCSKFEPKARKLEETSNLLSERARQAIPGWLRSGRRRR